MAIPTVGTTGTGNPIFNNPVGKWYGTFASPLTGDITLDSTGAITSGLAILYHNDSAAPSFSGLTVEKTSGTYVLNTLNLIYIVKTPTGVSISYQSEALPENTASPTISGFAYPQETLTVDEGTWTGTNITYTYQWTADGSEISGATSSTYSPTVEQVGAAIICKVTATNSSGSTTANSETVTVWHPIDESGVAMVFLANTQVLNSTSPDTEATDGQAVTLWRDQTANGWDASGSGTTRPLRQVDEINSNDVVSFDGTDDLLSVTATAALDVFRNKDYGYVIAAVSDKNPTAGDDFHPVSSIARGSTAAERAAMYTRFSATSQFLVGGRRLDADAFSTVSAAAQSGYNVVTGQHLWADNTLGIRVNGVQGSTTTFASGAGKSENTASLTIKMGESADGNFQAPDNLAAKIVVSPAAVMTAQSMARLERYVGLLIGKDIALAEA